MPPASPPGTATFEPEPPSWAAFDASKLPAARGSVALDSSGTVLGWATASAGVRSLRLSPGSSNTRSMLTQPSRAAASAGPLLAGLATSTEAAGIWTIQSGIFPKTPPACGCTARHGFQTSSAPASRVGENDLRPVSRSMARCDP